MLSLKDPFASYIKSFQIVIGFGCRKASKMILKILSSELILCVDQGRVLMIFLVIDAALRGRRFARRTNLQ